MLILTIKQGKERSLLQRQPLIYVSAVARVDGKAGERLQSGITALIQSSSGKFLARAAYSPQSQIRARVWSFDPTEAIDHAFIKRRVAAALNKYREAPGAVTQTIAAPPGQLMDGAEDGLSGLRVDWFMRGQGYLICQFFAAGVDAWKVPIVQALLRETSCPNIYERSAPLMRKAEALPDLSGALAGDDPPADVLAWYDNESAAKTPAPKTVPLVQTAGRSKRR